MRNREPQHTSTTTSTHTSPITPLLHSPTQLFCTHLSSAIHYTSSTKYPCHIHLTDPSYTHYTFIIHNTPVTHSLHVYYNHHEHSQTITHPHYNHYHYTFTTFPSFTLHLFTPYTFYTLHQLLHMHYTHSSSTTHIINRCTFIIHPLHTYNH